MRKQNIPVGVSDFSKLRNTNLNGVIENLKYVTDDRGVRQAFGCVYTTDFASHIFYIALVIFYLKGNRLRWFHYVALIVVAGLV